MAIHGLSPQLSGIFRSIYIMILLLPTVVLTLAMTDKPVFPVSFSESNNLAGYIVQTQPSIQHYESLVLIVEEYVSMCEGGWDTTIRIFNTYNDTSKISNWTPMLRRMFRYKSYCYRTASYLHIEYYVQEPSKDPKVSSHSNLISLARDTLLQEINEKKTDVYILSTDETLVKHSHLSAYLHETKKLNGGQGMGVGTGVEEQIPPYTIGFQSYRRLLRLGEHHVVAVAESELLTQDMVERNAHSPAFHLMEVNNQTYMVVGGEGKKTGRGRQLSNGERETREGRGGVLLVSERELGENGRERERGRKLSDGEAHKGGVRGSNGLKGGRSGVSMGERDGGGRGLMNEKEGGGRGLMNGKEGGGRGLMNEKEGGGRGLMYGKEGGGRGLMNEKEGGGRGLMNEKEGGGRVSTSDRGRDLMDGEIDDVTHYDMQIITRSEIERLKEENCLFVPPSMLALAAPASSRHLAHCRTQKVIPVDHFFSFLVNHFYDLGDSNFTLHSSHHNKEGGTGTDSVWLAAYEVNEHLQTHTAVSP